MTSAADVAWSATAALAALAATSTATMSLDAVLAEVAERLLSAVPGADTVAVTFTSGKRRLTRASSTGVAADVEAAQHTLAQGPSICAVQEGRIVRVGSLPRDPRFPRLAGRAARLGIHAALAIPMRTSTGILGVMTAYARQPDAFDDHSERAGTVFAAAAAVVIENSSVLQTVRDLAGNLQTALTSRPVIDQAIGIIMSRTGLSPDEAFERLRARSQAEHTKVTEVARDVVDAAVRRARSRRAPNGPMRP